MRAKICSLTPYPPFGPWSCRPQNRPTLSTLLPAGPDEEEGEWRPTARAGVVARLAPLM